MVCCKTISIESKQHIQTSKNIILGSLGSDENFILEKTYTNTGIPNISRPVKVKVRPVPFNSGTYQTYTHANSYQNQIAEVIYHDSLRVKPYFFSIDISDRITLIDLLNDKENSDIKDFLLNDNDTHVVTGVSIALSRDKTETLRDAQEVFLEESGINSIALKLYNNSQLISTINFSEGVVFSYRTANVCWKENSKYQLEIVNLVEGDNSCPKQSYRSSKRAKKEINYYKF
jgi:hypothetical protein